MYAQSFRDLNAYDDEAYRQYGRGQALKTFWSVVNDKSYGGPKEKEEAILKWLNDFTEITLQWREPVTRVQKLNVKLYKGLHYISQEEWSRIPYSRGKRYSKNYAKIVCNYLHDAAETHVSDFCGYEPALTVLPANNEEIDKVCARMNKDILDYYFYENQLKVKFQTFHRRKKVMGETFKFVLWDVDAGDLYPAYKQLRDMRREMGLDPDMAVPVVDPETGEIVKGDDGVELFISAPVRQGDISYQDEFSWNVLYPTPESGLWEDVDYVERLIWMPIDDVRARWKKSGSEVKADGRFRTYLTPSAKSLHPMTLVRFFYHRPTAFLNSGYYCVSTETAMLESGPYPFNHRELPCIRGTDIDIPGELHGMSFFQNLVTLQQAINNATSMILQNQALYAYPKYQSPRGAKVKYTELDDDRGIYEYSGPKGPELVAVNSTPQDVWKWRDAMRDELKTHSAIFATSQGRGVDGITANVALRLIEEQERKLHKPAIDKHGANVEKLGFLTLSTLGTYRTPEDGALIKILGRNNERSLKYWDASSLSRPFEVRLQKSSGLPQSPAAKTQTVLDIAQQFPDLWTHDEVLEYLDIARPEKLVESATVSRQSAESEVEDILQGIPVQPPQPYHDILPRYRVFEKAVQSRAFDEASPDVKQRMINHIITAEYIISKKMMNPAFAQIVMQRHPNFPIFFPLTPPQPMTPTLPGAPMGDPNAANLAGLPPEAAMSAEMPPAAQDMNTPNALPQNLVPQEGQLP